MLHDKTTSRQETPLQRDRSVECPRDGTRLPAEVSPVNLKVCPHCGSHLRLSARERIRTLVDPDSFEELSTGIESADPLGFVDVKPYSERLREAQERTGEKEAALFGTARIAQQPLVLAVMDFGFIGGAMGSVVGEVITRAIETAWRWRLPLVIVTASGGARMQEGCLSLLQMAKTSAALARLADAGVPYLVVLTDPTYGGVTASFATLGDILIAEPEARVGFAGQAVIEKTIRKKLPEDFQRAESLLRHGMIDMVVPRDQLRETLGRLLGYYRTSREGKGQGVEVLPQILEPTPSLEVGPPRDAWEVVRASREGRRPTTLDYLARVFDEFHALHGDRLFGEDGAVVGGLARLGGLACMALGTQRGRTFQENTERNFGMPHPEGYRKALRLMQHAARFHLPVVTFVDTLGAYPGDAAEQRGQALAIARNLLEMARLPVPVVAILTGQGGSGGALALALADRLLILENAYYSVITPEACSIILHKDPSAAERVARSLHLTPEELQRLGLIDEVLPEPPGRAHRDFDAVALTIRSALVRHLRELLPKSPRLLLEERQERYRNVGVESVAVGTPFGHETARSAG